MPHYSSGAFLFLTQFMTSTADLYKIFLQHPNVQTDTRLLAKDCIFFALKGENFDGNSYALKAIENGAAYAVVDDKRLAPNDNLLFVNNVLETLQQLALHHRQQSNIPVLAITGSNGKTTTKELVSAVLSQKYNVLATIGNLNNHIGVPLTLLRITAQHNFAIIEMGANHQKEIAAYCNWTLPNYGLINNCGKAHLEGFGGIDGVRKGKGELYDFLRENAGTIFRNADLDYLENMATGIENQTTYGEYKVDIRGKIYEREPYLKIAIINSGKEKIIDTKLIGDYNLPNVLAAISVGSFFNVNENEITKAIATYQPDNNRSEYRMVRGVNVILDAYNANPSSVHAALASFNNMAQKNKIVMLGAMMELGTDSDAEHNAVLQYAQQFAWKNIITVGKNFKQHAKSLGITHFDTAEDAKKWLWHYVEKDDWVYIKGSRLTAMEKIIA